MAAAGDGGRQRRQSAYERRADRGQQTTDGDQYTCGETMRLALGRVSSKVVQYETHDSYFHDVHVQQIPVGLRHT